MKNNLNWILAIVLTLITSVSVGKTNYKVTRVIDGDTIEFRADFLPAPLKPVLSLRIVGVDTPEKGSHSHCELEEGMAQEATDFTKSLVEKSSEQVIIIKGWDKYGGRVLGDVFLDGKSLRTSLLDKGFARPYFGNKKQSWCEE